MTLEASRSDAEAPFSSARATPLGGRGAGPMPVERSEFLTEVRLPVRRDTLSMTGYPPRDRVIHGSVEHGAMQAEYAAS